MERDQINDKKKLVKIFYIAMIAIMAVIAIILVNLISKDRERSISEKGMIDYGISNINVVPNTDEKIDKFIRDYFKARTDLNFSKIFMAYNRDYYKEERESRDDTFKNIIDNIRYERIFVKSYDDIKIYTEKGFYDDEIVCIVTYDMTFGFTTDKAPMIIVFYIKKNGDSFIIKDDLDVGTSKYVVDVVNTDFVKELYNDTYVRLNRVLTSNESLKLVYNSFRQSEMNMKSSLGSMHKKEIIEKITANKIDPIKDAKKIYDEIVEKKEEESKQKELDEYLDRVIASLSDTQRAY
ncbi:MAG: hypothetical protein IKI71_00805 [Lachnospiraceae bacterium]|nr:hypothetical protein [Lachnospiraceae bacterium]